MKVFLDMDGVLADFNQALKDRNIFDNEGSFIHLPRNQWTLSQLDLDRRVRQEMEKPAFWPSIPPMPDAYQLWDYCKQFDHSILTATPAVTEWRDRIAVQKMMWVQNIFGPFPLENIIVCLRKDKHTYAHEGAILVDDMKANCDEWTAAGGTAIQHVSAAQSIKQLQEIVHER